MEEELRAIEFLKNVCTDECVNKEFVVKPILNLIEKLKEENKELRKFADITLMRSKSKVAEVIKDSVFFDYIPISVIQNKKNFILDILRKHKLDLDYEPWSEYKISGSILFDIVYFLEELDKLKE